MCAGLHNLNLNINFKYFFVTMVHQIHAQFVSNAVSKALIVHKCSYLSKLHHQEGTLNEFVTFQCPCVKVFQLSGDLKITLSTWTHFVNYGITSQFGPQVY